MNQEEYYIGQIFEGRYPPEAAIWCNMHNAYIDEIADHKYEIKAVPEPAAPTKEEQEQARARAYAAEIDPLHARKMRKSILEEWSEEDEVEYEAEVKRLSAEIAERYPYPTDPIYAEEAVKAEESQEVAEPVEEETAAEEEVAEVIAAEEAQEAESEEEAE